MDSKYTLVHIAARRAREINLYYHSLGEGLGQYTPPLVEQVDSNKPLSIALEEVAAGKIVPQYPGDARRVAEELLGGEDTEDTEDTEDADAADAEDADAAEVLSLGADEAPAEEPDDDDA